MKKNNFFILFFKGIAIGLANMIAGISGGTMAFIVGVYEDMISALANLTKKFWPNFLFLLKLGLGIIVGIAFMAKLLNILFDVLLLETVSLFAGIILGGCFNDIPKLKLKKEDKKWKYWLGFAIAFLLVVVLAIVNILVEEGSFDPNKRFNNVSFGQMIILFFAIIIGATAMIFPGISGSLVFMILGIYYGVLNAISDFTHFSNWQKPGFLWNEIKIFVPLILGAVLTLIFISKPIKWLFEHHEKICMYVIMGFVLGSIPAMYIVNSVGIINSFTPWHLVFSLIFTIPLGFSLSVLLNKASIKKTMKESELVHNEETAENKA